LQVAYFVYAEHSFAFSPHVFDFHSQSDLSLVHSASDVFKSLHAGGGLFPQILVVLSHKHVGALVGVQSAATKLAAHPVF